MSAAPASSAQRGNPWEHDPAASQWYGFGRYYAMFPPFFAHDAVTSLTRKGDMVLDPFCGRGNAPFTATVLGRRSLGIDINPVAWLFTAAKLRPERSPERLLRRLEELRLCARAADRRARSEFERMAWAPGVRAFLRAARRELDWRGSVTDRTLMAFVALHMQDKQGSGLSNVLWPTIACSPRYAVDWWTRHGFLEAPDVAPALMLREKIIRRYRHGTPDQVRGHAILGDARTALRRRDALGARLLITSPPYNGITDYWNDHWIRLWVLGHAMRKDWRRSAKHENQEAYESLISDVFLAARRHLSRDATILVRSDQRKLTARICARALSQAWPNRRLYSRTSIAPHHGISVHHGRGGRLAKEIDFLIPGGRCRNWRQSAGFRGHEAFSDG